MALTTRCRSAFERNTEKKGEHYFRSRRVKNLEVYGTAATAKVDGNGGDYLVDISWAAASTGNLQVSCTCPHFADGFCCKHIWAVLRSLDTRGISNSIQGDGSLRVERYTAPDIDDVSDELDEEEAEYADEWNDGWDDDDDDDDDDGHWGPSSSVDSSRNSRSSDSPFAEALASILKGETRRVSSSQPKSKANAKSASSWKASLIRAIDPDESTARHLIKKPQEIWYVFNIADSMTSRQFVIDFFHRPLKQNGEWGKFRRYTPSLNELDDLSSPDCELLTFLMTSDVRNAGLGGYRSYSPYGYGRYGSSYGYSGGSTGDVWIGRQHARIILPRLCQTDRFVWMLQPADEDYSAEPRCRFDEGEPWRIRISCKSDAKAKSWRLSADLVRGDEARSFRDAILMGRQVALYSDTWVAIDQSPSSNWVSAIPNEGELVVPFSDRAEFLEAISNLPPIETSSWPSELTVETVDGQPQGVLRLKREDRRTSTGKYLFAELLFDYLGEKFAATDSRRGVFHAESNRLVRRDPQSESELVSQLDALQFTVPTGWEIERTGAIRKLHERHLMATVEKLAAAGWIVEAEGMKLRRPGQVKLSVTSSTDWFELDGRVDFDGVSASLPSLLRAVRNNEKFVRLDDGTHGLLPQEWLDKYGRLAELGEADGDSLRFSSSQAMLLDALIAAQEQDTVAFDAQFDQCRKRLRSFDGVEPATAPDGFQGELRSYQRDGLGWLHFLREFGLGGCLADDMGLGKTVQVLALLESRRQLRAAGDKEIGPSLVVVPKSLVFNWIEEAGRFTPELRVMNYTGLGRAERREQFDHHDVIVTTYGTLRRDVVELKDRSFDYAILDESQAIKNAGSQAAKAVRLINAKHRLAMTGTPVENHLGELWSLFEFLNPGMLGRSAAFASLSRGGGGSDADKRQWLELLAQALRPFLLRRTKQQVLKELPEKTEQTLVCEMSPKERKKYIELRDYYRAQLTERVAKQGLEKSKIHVLEALLRLRQAACHPALLDPTKKKETSAKLEILFEQLDEILAEGHKALVFSQFTSLLDIVRGHLDKRKIVYEYLDGRTRNRGAKVKRFQEDADCPLFLISLKAGGHGLNLTAADYVFILDPWWNPAVEAQAVDRAHRIGQTRNVFAYRLICRDTVEDKIIELQKTKRELADAIVSADNSLLRNLTADDLARLFE